MKRPANEDAQAILDDVFSEKKEDVQVYARIPADLNDEVLAVKAATKKSLADLVEAGLRLIVNAHHAKIAKKNGEVA